MLRFLLLVNKGLSGIVNILSLLLISTFLYCLIGWALWTNDCLYRSNSASFSLRSLSNSRSLSFSFIISSFLLLKSKTFLSSARTSVLNLNGLGFVKKNLDDFDEEEAGALDGLLPSSILDRADAFFFQMFIANLSSEKWDEFLEFFKRKVWSIYYELRDYLGTTFRFKLFQGPKKGSSFILLDGLICKLSILVGTCHSVI